MAELDLVYIAAPLSAPTAEGMAENRARGRRWCAWAARHFYVTPVAMWIVLSEEWPETPENRALGLDLDFSLILRCDALWLCGGRISSGMQLEADHARKLGVPVRDLTLIGSEPPEGGPAAEWRQLASELDVELRETA